MPRGLFITFEGGEGAGKGTQLSRLADRLRALNHEVVCTREPGGTPEAEKIRDLLVQRDGGNWIPMAEILLFFAARVQHVEQKIKPAIALGNIVISDRFTDSTRAYQAYGRGMDLDLIDRTDVLALSGFKPDLTLIFDIDPAIGLARSQKGMSESTDAKRQTEDRFEQVKFDFHTRLRQGYLDIASREPDRCVVINAARPVDDVAQDVWKTVEQRLIAHG